MFRRLRNPEVAGWVMLAGAIVAAAALVLWLERDISYGWDEYIWQEIAGLSTPDQFWHPYGGHLIVLPYYIFHVTLQLFGASWTAFGLIQVVGLSLIGLLVYVYGKRRVGPLLALGPAIVMLFLGGAYPILIEPMIGIQFLAALVPGLAAIVLLEREDLRGDLAACVLLVLSVAAFSEGLIFLAGACVAVALSSNWKRRLWVVAVPILAYGYWRLWATQFHEPTGIIGSNIPLLPPYFADALAVYSTATFGLAGLVGPGPWSQLRLYGNNFSLATEGVVLLLFELLAIAAATLALRRRLGSIPRSLWPALAMLFVFWVELGVIFLPGRTAAEPRYLYTGVLLLLLVVLELARGVRASRVAVLVVLAVTAAAVIGNLARFHDGRAILKDYSTRMRADMAVIELAGKDADQAFTPNVDLPAVVPPAEVLNTGPWQLVAERYGSRSFSIPELQAQAEAVRVEADRVARRALRLRLEPASAAGECRLLPAAKAAAGFPLPAGGVTLIPATDTSVDLRRWADEFAVGLGPVTAGETTALRIPTDASPVPWSLRLEPGTPVQVCPLR